MLLRSLKHPQGNEQEQKQRRQGKAPGASRRQGRRPFPGSSQKNRGRFQSDGGVFPSILVVRPSILHPNAKFLRRGLKGVSAAPRSSHLSGGHFPHSGLQCFHSLYLAGNGLTSVAFQGKVCRKKRSPPIQPLRRGGQGQDYLRFVDLVVFAVALFAQPPIRKVRISGESLRAFFPVFSVS